MYGTITNSQHQIDKYGDTLKDKNKNTDYLGLLKKQLSQGIWKQWKWKTKMEN